MAGVIVRFAVGDSGTTVALVAGTEKKVLEVRPATNHGIRLLSWGLSFDGTTAGNSPVEVALCRGSGISTYSVTGGAVTGAKETFSRLETIQTTGRSADGANTGETRAIIQAEHIHPQGGGYSFQFTMGQEGIAEGGSTGGSTAQALYLAVKAAQNVNCKCWFRIEE